MNYTYLQLDPLSRIVIGLISTNVLMEESLVLKEWTEYDLQAIGQMYHQGKLIPPPTPYLDEKEIRPKGD